MKKILTTLGAGLLLVSTVVAQPTKAWKFIPLFSGYNVLLTTNGAAGTAVGLGTSNVLFTTYQGQVLNSLNTNLINGVLTTSPAPDAFKAANLVPDVNGDVNANASLFICIGNTNYIPQVTTNSVGQWFVPPAGFTNGTYTTPYGGWPLASSTFPNWSYPATTNYYPLFGTTATNAVIVNVFKGVGAPQGVSAPLGPPTMLWETPTASFSFTVVPQGVTPVSIFTNLPSNFMQSAGKIYVTLTLATNAAANQYVLVNQCGLYQPQ